ncbi:MAG: DUF4190 domain-containing protein [Acidimicrobiia bacterium]
MAQPPEWEQPQAGFPIPPPPPPPGPALPMPGSIVGPYGQPPVVGARTDGNAIASLCCSLGFLAIGCLGIVTSILAIVFAAKAERNIAASGGTLGGAGLAKAGKIIGWIGIGLCVAGVVLYALIAVFILSSSPN